VQARVELGLVVLRMALLVLCAPHAIFSDCEQRFRMALMAGLVGLLGVVQMV
jgi:hypothetical protein